jgi:hypothetical protein
MPVWIQDVALKPLFKLMGMIEPWEGAQSSLYALLSPDAGNHNGGYFSQVGIYRSREANRGGWPLQSPNPVAKDMETALQLEKVSRSLVF